MSVFAPVKPLKGKSKVHYSSYIKTENEEQSGESTKPAEPVNPDKPATE